MTESTITLPTFMEMPTGAGTIDISAHSQPRDKMPVRLFDTAYEYGTLEITVKRGGPTEEVPEVPGPEHPRRTHHSIPLITHPRRGALVVTTAWIGRGMDGCRWIEEQYGRIATNARWIRAALRARERSTGPHPYWADRELAFGPAVAVGTSDGVEVDLSGADVDQAVLLEIDDWEPFPTELERAMAHYADRVEDRRTEHAKHLATALKRVGPPAWEYREHVDCVASPDLVAKQLL